MASVDTNGILRMPAMLAWRDVYTELLRLMRTPSFSVPTLLLPVSFYALFALGMQPMGSGRSAIYLLSTYVIFGSMAPGLFGIGVQVATDRAQHWYDLQRATPVTAIRLLGAKLASCIVLALASMVLVMAVAGLVGGVKLAVGVWATLTLLAIWAAVPFGLLGIAIGVLARPGSAAALANLLFLPVAFLGGLWFPLQALLTGLQYAGWALPTYHLGQLALIATNQVMPTQLWTHIGASAAWTVVSACLAAWAYGKSLR